jgi:SAM-dependent methyltransferase
MMSGSSLLQSFRDPAGRVEVQDNVVLRHVHPHSRKQALDLLGAAFYRRSQERGEIVGSQIRQNTAPGDLVLEHPRVFFQSYCWEWVPALWVAAGELTLRLCEQAVAEGWILKDATPLNVLFEGSMPVFVDLLSLERRNLRFPVWTAHAQFIRTFLLPLIARRWLGWPLASALWRRDGIAPEEVLPSMPWSALWRPMLLWNVALPAMVERRATLSEERIEAAKSRECDPEIAIALINRMLGSLGGNLRRAGHTMEGSRWSRYQEELNHYPEGDQQDKYSFVHECLRACHPLTVLDVGANTGAFSLLAAKTGARVVAIDTDMASMELLCKRARAERADVQPLVVNLARPTPAAGWNCQEQLSFLDRASGRFEMVLMLAVIHHLLLTEQIPLSHILHLCSEISTRWLIVEWIPSDDPMFRKLLRGRGNLYGNLSQNELLNAASAYFRIERKLTLANRRVLYLFAKTT